MAVVLSGVSSYMVLYRPDHYYIDGWNWFLAGASLFTAIVLTIEASKTTALDAAPCDRKNPHPGPQHGSHSGGFELVFALVDQEIHPYEQSLDGTVRFKYMNRKAWASNDDGTLIVGVTLPFDNMSLSKRSEVGSRIRRIDGLQVIVGEESDELTCVAMVPAPSDINGVMKDILNKMRMVIGIFEETALIPANEARSNIARMLVKAFLQETKDECMASVNILESECENPFYADTEKSVEFSTFIKDAYGISVLPENVSRETRLKRVIKFLSVYCDADTCYRLGKRVILGVK